MYKKGSFVVIKTVNPIIEDYLRNHITSGIKIDTIKILCSIQENKKYVVVDYCKSCKRVSIKIKNSHISIKEEFLEEYAIT